MSDTVVVSNGAVSPTPPPPPTSPIPGVDDTAFVTGSSPAHAVAPAPTIIGGADTVEATGGVSEVTPAETLIDPFNEQDTVIPLQGMTPEELTLYQRLILLSHTVDGEIERAQSAEVDILADAKLYADASVATYSTTVAATYATHSSVSSAIASASETTLASAKSYADGAVASLSTTISASFVTTTALSTALSSASATTLSSAESYADSAVSTLSTSVSSSYVTNSTYTGQVGDLKTFGVCATGLSDSDPGTPGLFVNGASSSANSPGRSYNVWTINRSDGSISSFHNYDVFAGSDAASMASFLNGLSDSVIVVVATYDEPQTHRLDSGLAAAMYRCGASRAVFGNTSAFKFRSAYILVGIPGEGEGNGIEKYSGSIDSDTHAIVSYAFALRNGYAIGIGGGVSNAALNTLLTTAISDASVTTLNSAKSYADGAVASLSTSVSATYVTNSTFTSTLAGYPTITSMNSAISSANASTLSSANAHADGAVASLSSTISASYVSNSSLASTLSSYASAASVTSEATARASADGALSSSISSLSTTVGANSASITTLASSVGGLSAQWSVQAAVDGTTGGLKLTGMKRADGTGTLYNLEIDANVTINGGLVVNESIDNAQVANNAISHSAFATGNNDTGSFTMTSRRTSRVALIAAVEKTAGDIGTGPSTIHLNISVNGVTQKSVQIGGAADDGYGGSIGYVSPLTVICSYVVDPNPSITDSGTYTESSYYTDHQGSTAWKAGYAFDASANTAWWSNGTSTGWIAWHGSAAVAKSYRVMGWNSAAHTGEGVWGLYYIANPTTASNAPKNWTLDGSNDGWSWTTLDTQTNQTGWGDGEERTFTMSNTTSYAYYRLNVSANNGGSYLNIIHFSVYTTVLLTGSSDLTLRAWTDLVGGTVPVSLLALELSK